MTDIVLELVSDPANNSTPNVMKMNVEFPGDKTSKGEVLSFEKVSPKKWNCNGTIELTDDVIFKAPLDNIGRTTSLNLGQAEIEKFSLITVPTELSYNFLTEPGDSTVFRLKFQIVNPLVDEEFLKDSTDFKKFIKKDGNRVLSAAQDRPDDMFNKPVFMDVGAVPMPRD
ncbi:hypothetical protein GALMADRAFT_256338 [Galerina marginata CBS 339.88]|uniref:Uncharacterized protein n=1 Tax=Galerina marginata (strain CBS 339.88) TaxID=685588 RepID=A0A067SDW4_GALM3|nr:hypothetical protein GALMADRAFT_256338 [Galerina marginata CBS 339.88]